MGPDEPKALFENWEKCSVNLLSQLWGGNSALSPFPVGAFIEVMQPHAWQPRPLQIVRLTFPLGKIMWVNLWISKLFPKFLSGIYVEQFLLW